MKSLRPDLLAFLGPMMLIVAAHAIIDAPSEPYFNNDETRHVMTGVFFRDMIADVPMRNPKDYAVHYYLQYPALGLMVWPPLFYGVEGVWMTCFGTSFASAKLLVGVFGFLGGLHFSRLVNRTHGPVTAALALGLLGFSPLVFLFSRQVMLELPCLAIILATIFHFERYLDEQRRRDAWLTCLLAALATLTRFDGVMLLPYCGLRLLMTGNLRLLRRGPVMGGILLAVILAGPYYLFTWREYGSTIAKTAQEGTSAGATSFFAIRNFSYYPFCIPDQIGWFATVAAVIGFCFAFRRSTRRVAGPYFALLAATYAFFTPIAELDIRHTIYWVPALAMFAAIGCTTVAELLKRPKIFVPVSLIVLAGTIYTTWREPVFYVFGYEEAAQYVVKHNRETRVCVMDGFLNGDFIYQVRRHDLERRLWTLRGDKLFYTVLCDPHAGYKEHAREEQQILDLIHRFDPELIVVEEPQLYFELPVATLLRQVLRAHPERFTLEKSIPIRSNHFRFANARLEIWRNHVRNPNRVEKLEIEMLTIGRSLGTEIKK
ncbi:MAG: glycosyltransferase family 39 protein [Planctomycetes bacterium]|nr:glycosyltransferase family 39 protein [Planctomycetota bacterium]